MNEVVVRIISGVVMIALMVWAILYSVTAGQILFAFIVFIASFEYFRMTKAKSWLAMTLATLALTIYGILILMASPEMEVVKLILFSISILLCLYRLFIHGRASTFLARLHGVLLLSAPFGILADWLFRDLSLTVLSIFILLWVHDTMSYVCGRLLGRHKLMPRVSPGKTWEGFLGGVLFTGIVSYIGNSQLELFTAGQAILFGVIISALGTVGDLFESRVKRIADVKDSGAIMPGHGGLLDRFDGLVISVPFLFLLFDYCSNLLH